jgi:alanine-synthesizing transaminase
MRRQGRIRYDLTTTNPTRAGFDYNWAGLRGALSAGAFELYAPESLGALPARQQIVDFLINSHDTNAGFVDVSVTRELHAENLLLTSSTSEAYGYLFKLLCDPGDSVLIPTPSYPLVERLAAYEGVTSIPYDLAYDGAWHLNRQSVAQATTQAPRAIVVVSPNNPTGSCISHDDLDFLGQFGIPLIIDQVFAPYVLGSTALGSTSATSRPATPSAAGAGLGPAATSKKTLTFVLDGLSKRCALPQLKLGWVSVCGEAHDVERTMTALAHVADTYLSVNRPAEAAVGAILELTHNTRRSIRERLATNLHVLHSKTRASSANVLHFQGGWSAIVRLPAYQTDEQWVYETLDRGVLVQPGWLYDIPLAATVVVSLITPTEEFAAGIDELCRVVRG